MVHEVGGWQGSHFFSVRHTVSTRCWSLELLCMGLCNEQQVKALRLNCETFESMLFGASAWVSVLLGAIDSALEESAW